MPGSSYFRRELLPPARGFYEKEVGPLSRPDRRGWAKPKAGCPFHASRSKTSFHVKLDSGSFICHGCGVTGGDVIDFLRKRYGYDFKTAAKILGAWREDLTREERMRLDERVARQRYEREQAEQAKQASETSACGCGMRFTPRRESTFPITIC